MRKFLIICVSIILLFSACPLLDDEEKEYVNIQILNGLDNKIGIYRDGLFLRTRVATIDPKKEIWVTLEAGKTYYAEIESTGKSVSERTFYYNNLAWSIP